MKTKKERISDSNIGKADSAMIARHLMVNNKLAKKRNVELENLFVRDYRLMRHLQTSCGNHLKRLVRWTSFQRHTQYHEHSQ